MKKGANVEQRWKRANPESFPPLRKYHSQNHEELLKRV
jgi:hypothetical protein